MSSGRAERRSSSSSTTSRQRRVPSPAALGGFLCRTFRRSSTQTVDGRDRSASRSSSTMSAQATMRLIPKDARKRSHEPDADPVERRDDQPLSHRLHQGGRTEHARSGRAVSRRRGGDRDDRRRRRSSCRSRWCVTSRSSNSRCARSANFGGRLFISTIAEITFYGADAMGNDIQAKGTISVSFSDYADPE